MTNKFAHIGMGTIVQAERVILITLPGTTTANRYIEIAQKAGKYHNATLGHKRRSVIVMDDGTTITSTITPMTLMRRMNSLETPYYAEDFEEAALEAAMEDEVDRMDGGGEE